MADNVALLRLMNLPVFSNQTELASLMHVTPGLIGAINKSPHKFYRRYKIAKSDGNQREIRQPRKDVKTIQAWILRNILDKLSMSPYATAYIKGKSILDNVSPHCNNRYFVSLDLEDFFPSISVRRIAKIFNLIGYSRQSSSILSRLCTCKGNLPQGAVTSPALSNIVAAKLDRRIAGYTSKRNITFTRYSDDITLSSDNRYVLCKSVPMILKIIKSEHFKPNMRKLRILGPRRRCSITGLVKNSSEPKYGIGTAKKREMRAVMHHHLFGLGIDTKYTTETSLIGWLNYLKDVDEDSFHQMSDYWNRLKERSKSL